MPFPSLLTGKHGTNAQYLFKEIFLPMKMDRYIKDIGNFVQREQESLLEALKILQEMIRRCLHHGFSQQRLVRIFCGGVSSHNRTSLDATCGGVLMLKLSIRLIGRLFAIICADLLAL